MDRQIKTNFRLEQWEERRFIGKSIYVRAVMDASPENIYSSKLCGALWAQKDWIFEELDKMSEYATEDQEAVGLITWEKFDEKNMLFGYTVGRFMKAGTPVPAYMDYIDLPAVCVAKGTKKQPITSLTAGRQAISFLLSAAMSCGFTRKPRRTAANGRPIFLLPRHIPTSPMKTA